MTASGRAASPLRGPTEITRVKPTEWRTTCLQACEDGERFEGLFAAEREDRAVELRAVFSSPPRERVIACETPSAPSRASST